MADSREVGILRLSGDEEEGFKKICWGGLGELLARSGKRRVDRRFVICIANKEGKCTILEKGNGLNNGMNMDKGIKTCTIKTLIC